MMGCQYEGRDGMKRGTIHTINLYFGYSYLYSTETIFNQTVGYAFPFILF